jgi:hypothetical protein
LTSPANPSRGTTIPVSGNGTNRPVVARASRTRRLSTETKAAFKTTEFWVFIAMCVAVLIASLTVGSDSNATAGNSGDYFRADKAWLYITILTFGYMLSRGFAKSGSRDFYDDEQDAQDN